MIEFILIYIGSYFVCLISTRLMSSRYLDAFLDSDCKISSWWVIPIINTIYAIMMTLFVILESIKKIDAKQIKLPKSKFFNTDL